MEIVSLFLPCSKDFRLPVLWFVWSPVFAIVSERLKSDDRLKGFLFSSTSIDILYLQKKEQ